MAGKRESVPPSVPVSLSLQVRVGVSLLLFVHLTAVFFPPFTFATSSGPGLASPFARPVMQALRPYIEFLFLDHGYFFFAPNPGPSHLIKAKLDFADGRQPQELTFPDRNQQKPRLLYHRHFMLAEQLNAEFVMPEPPPEIQSDPEQFARWQRARQNYESRRKSFEAHLKATYNADRVTITRIEHRLYSPGEFQDRRPALNDPEGYRELPEGAVEISPASSRLIP